MKYSDGIISQAEGFESYILNLTHFVYSASRRHGIECCWLVLFIKRPRDKIIKRPRDKHAQIVFTGKPKK